MAPFVDPVPWRERPPERADVVVVGGGIIGCCTALSLAEKGVAVALLEKGVIAGEQSGRNWGWVRTAGRDRRELPLAIAASRLWGELAPRLDEDVGFRRSGVLYLAEDAARLERQERWLATAQDYQLDSRVLRAAELEPLIPGAARPFAGGLYTPSDGRAEPAKAAPAIARAAIERGASVVTGCAVRGVETEAGRVRAVVTEKGRVACDAVVVAGGAWSRLFCGYHGVDLPQQQVRASVFRTSPLNGASALPECNIWTRQVALRRRLDGGYTVAHGYANLFEIVPDSFRLVRTFLPALIMERKKLRPRLNRRFIEAWRTPRHWPLDGPSPFEAVRILDPEPVGAVNAEARAGLDALFPAFKAARLAESWGGYIDVTPDALPVISRVDARPGLYIATGFSGHGFGVGPAAGRLMADLVTGDPEIVDPGPFRFSRFAEVPRPRPEAPV